MIRLLLFLLLPFLMSLDFTGVDLTGVDGNVSAVSIAYQDECKDDIQATGALACDLEPVDVATGDLIVAFFGVQDGSIACTAVSDDIVGNTYTVRTNVASDGSNQTVAWVVSTGADATNEVTCDTYASDGTDNKQVLVYTFRPTGGSFLFDVGESNFDNYENDGTFETAGGLSTTGSVEVCVAGVQGETGSPTLSNHEIPAATAADDVIVTPEDHNAEAWYRILSSTASGIGAEVDSSGATGYSMEIVCFKAE